MIAHYSIAAGMNHAGIHAPSAAYRQVDLQATGLT